jgi:hypothetical protein
MLNVIWYIEGIYTTLTCCNTARQRGWYVKERADKKDKNDKKPAEPEVSSTG